jgi:hypothetical protein
LREDCQYANSWRNFRGNDWQATTCHRCFSTKQGPEKALNALQASDFRIQQVSVVAKHGDKNGLMDKAEGQEKVDNPC